MKRIEVTIFVVPTPWGRSGMTVIGGHAAAYKPKKTRNSEDMIAYAIRQQVMASGTFDVGVPLALSATFFLEKPKSNPKKMTKPVKRPDLDNYGKLLLDALNKYIWPDDSQIVDLHIKKEFGTPPRIELKIWEVLE